jgi:hypothetical protein
VISHDDYRDTVSLRLQDIADASVWERFSFAADHLASQKINLDANTKWVSKRLCLSKVLDTTRPVLQALLKEGVGVFKQKRHNGGGASAWTTAYAQSCSLYCCTCKAIGAINAGTDKFGLLVQRCLSTAEYLLATPLRVQPDARGTKKHPVHACRDADTDTPFMDNCVSTMKLHGHMTAREVVVSLHDAGVVAVSHMVLEYVVSGQVSCSERTLQVYVALQRLKIRQLRHRLTAALEQWRCGIVLI